MQKLTDKMQEVIDVYQSFGLPSLADLSPETARQLPTLADAVLGVQSKHMTKRILGPVESVAKIEHRLIPGPADPLLVRIYTPEGTGPFPVLVYFHGGGWVIANLDTYDSSCRALANASDFIVVSVAYRQAPEHPFPAPVEDAFAAYEWVLRSASSFNGDSQMVAVAGESAGGNLAAAVCLMAREKGVRLPLHQALIYPVTHHSFDTLSYRQNADAKPLSADMMRWFWNHYLRTEEDGSSPFASPLLANVHGLPPATVITAEIDPLCSEGEAYAQKLINAGLDVRLERFERVTHEFFGMTSLLPEARDAVRVVAVRLRELVDERSNLTPAPETVARINPMAINPLMP